MLLFCRTTTRSWFIFLIRLTGTRWRNSVCCRTRNSSRFSDRLIVWYHFIKVGFFSCSFLLVPDFTVARQHKHCFCCLVKFKHLTLHLYVHFSMQAWRRWYICISTVYPTRWYICDSASQWFIPPIALRCFIMYFVICSKVIIDRPFLGVLLNWSFFIFSFVLEINFWIGYLLDKDTNDIICLKSMSFFVFCYSFFDPACMAYG